MTDLVPSEIACFDNWEFTRKDQTNSTREFKFPWRGGDCDKIGRPCRVRTMGCKEWRSTCMQHTRQKSERTKENERVRKEKRRKQKGTGGWGHTSGPYYWRGGEMSTQTARSWHLQDQVSSLSICGVPTSKYGSIPIHLLTSLCEVLRSPIASHSAAQWECVSEGAGHVMMMAA